MSIKVILEKAMNTKLRSIVISCESAVANPVRCN